MMLKIFRIFSRSKYITDLFIIVALLTALSIPFYSLTNHYTQILDIIGSHKIISINTPNTFIIDTSEQLYDSTKPSTLLNTTLNSKCNQAIDISWDYVSISKVGSNKCIYTVVYAYSNLTAVSKIMDLKIFGKLNEGSILVGVDIANSLSVRIGDILQVRNLNSVKLFKVTGYVNLGNIAIISYKDSPNFLSKHTLLLVFDYSRDTTSGGMKGLLAKRGIKVYSANSINAFIKDIGASLILIVRVWFIPILMIMLISNLIKDGKIEFKKELTEKITYKDPCELVRHTGVIQAPRDVILNIKNVRYEELISNKENALCCGGGGLLKINNRPLVEQVNDRLMNEIAYSEADIVVNNCPLCLDTINQGVKKKNLRKNGRISI